MLSVESFGLSSASRSFWPVGLFGRPQSRICCALLGLLFSTETFRCDARVAVQAIPVTAAERPAAWATRHIAADRLPVDGLAWADFQAVSQGLAGLGTHRQPTSSALYRVYGYTQVHLGVLVAAQPHFASLFNSLVGYCRIVQSQGWHRPDPCRFMG